MLISNFYSNWIRIGAYVSCIGEVLNPTVGTNFDSDCATAPEVLIASKKLVDLSANEKVLEEMWKLEVLEYHKLFIGGKIQQGYK